MKMPKKLMLLAILALVPTAMFAADHIVFIHGYQVWDGKILGYQLTNGRADTWDRMVDVMSNPVYGTPFISSDKVLVVQHGISSDSIDEVAKDVWNQIKQGFPDGTCPSKMDFVVHSMGGLVLRSMVDQNLLSDSRIGRVVTLATPHYGTRWSGSTQKNQMQFGSDFIWKLANSDRKIDPSKILCVVGTEDGTVDEWSAALNDCATVRYVAKDHTAAFDFRGAGVGILGNNGICYCAEGRNDVVYRLVTEFLASGIVSHGATRGNVDGGAILFQIVDGKNHPVAYNSTLYDPTLGHAVQIVRNVKNADGSDAHRGYGARSPASTLKIDGKTETHFATDIGVGAVMDWGHGQPRAMNTGSYALEIVSSKDNVFMGFTSELIPVTRGRTTVKTIYAESVKPLDFVFLIDSTGSMGSSINSVKNNAKRLIEEKLANGARNCRVAVADYRDYPMSPYGDSGDYVFKLRCGFTTNATTAISALNTITANGGADTPEAVYSALANAIAMDWRPNAVKTIMLMCDAGPHDPEPWAPYYTKSKIIEMAKTLKVDDGDTESGIDDTYVEVKPLAKNKSLRAVRMLAAKAGESGIIGGVSIYPVLTYSSSSLRATFQDLATETEGKVIDSGSYASVAEAVGEVVEQSVAANGFETEIITARETDGSVAIRVFGGSTADAASIGYQVVSGSAVNGKDYTAAEGVQRLTWAEGERSYKTITIPVAEDASTSNDKFFSIILCDPSGMGLGSINVCRINLLDRDSDGEFRVGDIYVQGLSRRSDMGSVNGSGFCAAGSAVTLSATAKSGYVFTSWENGSTTSRRNITAQMASANAVDGVATYVASFIPLADLPVPTIESSGVVTGIVGQAVSWNLNYYSMSEATVKCEGLPSGLSFADGAISGTPDRRGISTVTFTVQNAKGSSSVAVSFVFVRDPSAPYLSMSGEEGEFDASSASTYNGYVVGFDGLPIGTLLVKAAKANARTGKSKITATLQLSNGKKISFRGETDNGQVSMTAADQVLTITLGKAGMTGFYGAYAIDGSRNFFTSKDKSEANAANDVIAQWIGAVNVVWDGGVASVSIAKKGKVKASVTLANGTKATASSQLLVGDEWLCVPVVVAKKANIAFTLWLPKGGADATSASLPQIDGIDGAVAGKAGALKSGAAFKFDASALASALGDATYAAQLPDGLSVEQDGKKWVVAGGAKAGKVQLAKGAESPADIDEAKAGANPSALKLTYKAKDGTFKGTFKAYTLVNGKPKATTVNVSGILVGDKGYGTLSVKKPSIGLPFEIK